MIGQIDGKSGGASGMALTKSALAMCVAMIATAAWAEGGPMPQDIARKLVEIGRVVDPPKTAVLFAPLQQKEPYQGVRIARDIRYGAAEPNLLDVFMPETSSPNRPVLVFVHGGAFVAGDKRGPGSPFYDNIMLWAVKNGFVGVNVNYRLAPQSPWPAAAEDLSAAMGWVTANVAARGGDPARIYLMGHSAGATHVGTYVSHPEFWGAKGSGLAGAILVSGLYDLTSMPLTGGPSAYFGTDPALYAERSSLNGLLKTKTPLMITAAELDPPQFVAQLELVKDGLCKSEHGCVRSFLLPQHSHMSEVYSINAQDTRLTDEILDFVKAGK
jgi:acetyl esterase/lipase